MVRFILLTFGFLGWAFYEMSGGSEFESASEKHARLHPAPAVTVDEVDKEPAQTVAQAEVIDTDPPEQTEVTRVSLNLTTLQEATEASDDTAQAIADAVAEEVANVDADTGVAINTDTLTTASADTPAIIPSLILPNDSGASNVTEASVQQAPLGDLRTVTGNRVNVRGGPGTDFGVVFKLAEGASVEVMEDNGDGWVRMRSVETGEEGWMADWLLSRG